jgi:hypothetical protein
MLARFNVSGLRVCVLLAVAATAAACDKAPLLAPTNSTISVAAAAKVLPTGGSTEVTAVVIEQAGTAVQNGTTVRFTTTLGTVSPAEAQTRNGVAITTFSAGSSSGVAQVRATSGAAKASDTNANLVEITVGAAAVNAITIRANPGSIGPAGGSVELIATVVADSGRALEGIGVTFNTDQGLISPTTATTNSSGEARTMLTTSQQSVVSATAGTKTSGNLTITVRSGPIVSVTCAPSSGTGNCAAVQASSANNTATVLFTVTKGSSSSALRSATIDFGDGITQGLGTLASGSTTASHTYNGPDGSTARPYTATVSATDINGESTSASTIVTITPKPPLTPISVNITAVKSTATATGQRWEFTADATGGGEGTANATFESYAWDFGDGTSVTTSGKTTAHVYDTASTEQKYTVSVTVRTTDGRTATGRTEILVDKRP